MTVTVNGPEAADAVPLTVAVPPLAVSESPAGRPAALKVRAAAGVSVSDPVIVIGVIGSE